MTRRYDEPVDVRCTWDEAAAAPGERAEVPELFLWRGRLYQVREVLAHWVETTTWWRPAALALSGAESAHRGGAVPAGVADAAAERELWRVEARAGLASTPGVYDLCRDPVSGCWTLARTVD